MILADNNTGSAVIDFGGITSAIRVQDGGYLEFRGLALTGPAPAHWDSINDTYIINTAFAALPSISTEPNATVSSMWKVLYTPSSRSNNVSQSISTTFATFWM